MRMLSSRPVLRWLAPLVFLLVIAGTGVIASRASADPALPDRTAEELLVELQQAKVDGLSGTVVQQASLGLPELPAGDGRSSDFNSLVSGSHTLRVWSAGPDKSRVALLGTLGESDLIVNGRDVWTWSSDDNAATHRRLSEEQAADRREPAPADMPKTPQEAAERVLAALSPTTEVSTDRTVEVAGRPAYELVLRPKDSGSLVTSVRMAVDGAEFVPLRVQVFGADEGKPAAEIAFTDVDFGVPDAAQFEFNPPPGATTKELPGPDPAEAEQARKQAADRAGAREKPTTVGTGWTTVLVATTGTPDADNGDLQSVLNQLPKESGTWGSGRVLRGTLVSAVLTDDGRLAVGAVRPELLFDALG